ncbi:hypothetical protein ACHAW5_002300 [Stephanodiscus triporus]|uniref:Methyltransferase domain-containing protein n=1 Tax=Stephanodiscus triporus TaxID=2934178 RepID=A0ABD3NIS7_9STRA
MVPKALILLVVFDDAIRYAYSSFARRDGIALASSFDDERDGRARHHGDPTNVVAFVPSDRYPGRVDRDGDGDGDGQRHMVIFRSPSRHTYGFAGGDFDASRYDLPEIELRGLLCAIAAVEHDDVRFVSTEGGLPFEGSSEDDDVVANPKSEPPDDPWGVKSRNRSKKKDPARNILHGGNRLLRWVESSNGTIHAGHISKAASRAVLTHATFSIDEVLAVTEGDWRDSSASDLFWVGDRRSIEDLERMDVIDISNPNMSQDSRMRLINTILRLLDRQEPELRQRLREWISTHTRNRGDVQMYQPVLIHHGFLPINGIPHHNRPSVQEEHNCMHRYIYLGCRTSIGPAGTRGAPSQTLRRTHRGLLKEYALKSRRTTNPDTVHLTSTAMEPEIGFLMANLALVGVNRECSRVLDPCCGSGRLLLYAAASGATGLVGVDSDPNVWEAAEWDHRSELAAATFFVGDVRYPSSTAALCAPNSVDAIVCDPPYNIGAPVLVDGKDLRPRNYHDRGDKLRLSNTDESMDTSPDVVPSILSIAVRVLVRGGRIVFLLPVRGVEMTKSLDELLSSRGFFHGGQESCCLRLLKHSSRKQSFSPTFSRWLVCMEKL